MIMEAITIVLRSGMGMQLTSVRPYLKPGTPIAIGRGGAVIADVVEGNTIEDKRQAAESAAGYIDSVESRLEGAESLELVVSALERTLLCIEKHAVVGQTGTTRQAMDALGNIRELAAAFLDQFGAREQPVKTGEPPYSAPTSACCGICSQQDHVDENCPWQGARAGLALVQQIDRHLVEHAQEFNAAPSEALKPSIFDIITGTAGQAANVPQVLPSSEEHAAQIEQVAAGLREDQAELAKSILVLGDWLERVEIEDGYVGVPVIEAVEVVVTELKRQQKTADPVVCRYGHWFAGDSDEATLIRERGICSDCAAVDDSWLGAQEPEGGEA